MESFFPFENPNLMTIPKEKQVMERKKLKTILDYFSSPPKKTLKNLKLK